MNEEDDADDSINDEQTADAFLADTPIADEEEPPKSLPRMIITCDDAELAMEVTPTGILLRAQIRFGRCNACQQRLPLWNTRMHHYDYLKQPYRVVIDVVEARQICNRVTPQKQRLAYIERVASEIELLRDEERDNYVDYEDYPDDQ